MSVTSQELEEMRSLYLHDAHKPILSHYYEILSTHKSRNQRQHWYNRWNPWFVYGSFSLNPSNLRWRDIERFRGFVLHFPVTAGQKRQVMVPHCSPSASLRDKKARGFTLTSGGHTPFLYPALDLSVSKSPSGNQPACILKSVTNPCYWHNTHCTRLSLVLWLFSKKKKKTPEGKSPQSHLCVVPVRWVPDSPGCTCWVWSPSRLTNSFCPRRRRCRRLPSWCSWPYASPPPSIFISSCPRPKIKHSWTSVRVLPRSTRSPTPPPATKWRWCWPSNPMRRRRPSRLRVPSSWGVLKQPDWNQTGCCVWNVGSKNEIGWCYSCLF